MDPVQRRVELFCTRKENTDTNLCKLYRQFDGPCKGAIDKRNCVYKQCKMSEMATMPICRKFKSISRRSSPRMLKLLNAEIK